MFAGHEAIQPLLEIQEEIRAAVGKPKRARAARRGRSGGCPRIDELAAAKLKQAFEVPEKLERYKRISEVKK